MIYHKSTLIQVWLIISIEDPMIKAESKWVHKAQYSEQ